MFDSLKKAFNAKQLPGMKHPCDFDVPDLPGLPGMDVGALASQAGVAMPGGLPAAPTSSAELFSTLLNASNDMFGAVKVLALALPENAAVQWACESCRLVGDKLPPTDLKALDAAELYVKYPGVRTAKLAAEAARGATPDWPGSWAAQAAALAGSYPDFANPMKWGAIGSYVAGGINLCSQIYSGSWKGFAGDPSKYASGLPSTDGFWSAAQGALPSTPGMPAPPGLDDVTAYVPPVPFSSDACAGCKSYRPFVEKGIAIASDLPENGENSLPEPPELPI